MCVLLLLFPFPYSASPLFSLLSSLDFSPPLVSLFFIKNGFRDLRRSFLMIYLFVFCKRDTKAPPFLSDSRLFVTLSSSNLLFLRSLFFSLLLSSLLSFSPLPFFKGSE